MTTQKNRIIDITREMFEDVMFSPDLNVVQKESTSRSELEHTTSLYVYESDEENAKPVEVYVRLIDNTGTFFWKETL